MYVCISNGIITASPNEAILIKRFIQWFMLKWTKGKMGLECITVTLAQSSHRYVRTVYKTVIIKVENLHTNSSIFGWSNCPSHENNKCGFLILHIWLISFHHTYYY